MLDNNLNTLEYTIASSSTKGFELIQEKLSAVEKLLRTTPLGHHEILNHATEQLFLAGGKRIRVGISLLSAGVFDADYKRSISLAAGIEMLHTATLVHDDLIDGSLLRRGLPTLNAGDNAELSVLIGDYLFARAANLVAATDNVKIMDQFAQTLMTILNGEITQQFTRWEFSHQGYYDRIYAKTGAMFVLAAKSPAILGGANKKHIQAIETYGHNVGIAFQIIDDILDFTGKQEQIGKPIGSDLQQGFITLPVLLYAQKYPEDLDLRVILENKNGKQGAVSRLIQSIIDAGMIDEAVDEAKTLVSTGCDSLSELPYSEYTTALSDIADLVVARTK